MPGGALSARLRGRAVDVVLAGMAVGAAIGAYVLSAYAGSATGSRRTTLLVFGAVLAGVVVLVGAVNKVLDARRLRTAERIAIDAEAAFGSALSGALAPITSYLGELGVATDLDERAIIAGKVRQAVVDAAVRLTAPDGRCAFYRADPSLRVLEREAYAGRATPAREEFHAGTPDGDAVIDVVRRGEIVFVENVAENPHVFPSTPGTYGTVIAVAVTAGERRLGLLTVDAPHVGDLTLTHVELLRVLANLLGSGLRHDHDPG
jgi:hypothetical protein